MSIAVCDDDTKIQSIVQEYICKYSMEKDIDIKVDCYDTGEELCNQYQRGKYDLIFLDIEFTGRSGVEVGSFIRDIVQDEKVQIAYISGKTKYALELFEYHPINFLIKPFTEADVQKIIIGLNKERKNVYCDWISDQDYLKRSLLCDATIKVINKRIEQSNCILLVDTPNSRSSIWVAYELKYAKNIGKPIYSVSIDMPLTLSGIKELKDEWYKQINTDNLIY